MTYELQKTGISAEWVASPLRVYQDLLKDGTITQKGNIALDKFICNTAKSVYTVLMLYGGGERHGSLYY